MITLEPNDFVGISFKLWCVNVTCTCDYLMKIAHQLILTLWHSPLSFAKNYCLHSPLLLVKYIWFGFMSHPWQFWAGFNEITLENSTTFYFQYKFCLTIILVTEEHFWFDFLIQSLWTRRKSKCLRLWIVK